MIVETKITHSKIKNETVDRHAVEANTFYSTGHTSFSPESRNDKHAASDCKKPVGRAKGKT